MTIVYYQPEGDCDECGKPSPTWSADSDRWNLAAATLPKGRESILCPACFIFAHESATGLRTNWSLTPGIPFIPLSQIIATKVET